VSLDLASPARERAQGLVGDARDLRGAAVDLAPGDAELSRQLGSQVGLVEVAGSLRPAVEALAVERPPLAVRRADQVCDRDVGVELRVASAAHPVAKGSRDEARAAGGGVAVGSKAGERCLALQEAERCFDRALVGVADQRDGSLIAGRPQHADRLRRREGEVEARHAVLADELLQGLAGARISPGEHGVELVALNRPLETQLGCSRAGPPPRSLPLARVVVVGAAGDRVEVVGLLALAELSDADHLQTCRASRREVRLFDQSHSPACGPGALKVQAFRPDANV
jgi:hypothetical protein